RQRSARLRRIPMARKHGGVARQLRERLETVIDRVDVAARKVGAPAALEEQRVACDKPSIEQEALAARCVAGGVQQFDVDVADAELVAVLVCSELGARNAGGA